MAPREAFSHALGRNRPQALCPEADVATVRGGAETCRSFLGHPPLPQPQPFRRNEPGWEEVAQTAMAFIEPNAGPIPH
jgi:hypothetical protein